ncbi:MAG TPA: hypothetical protein GXX75_27340 [Clostridiales bacterium]|nr:hypothetical protein [Clostridiales bacterium]
MGVMVILSGKAGSGKDTCGEYLVSLGFKRYAFADKLKEIARLMGWDGEKDERGRALLQELGMAGRKYDPDIWVKLVIEKMEKEKPENIVITDCRFRNEFDALVKFAEEHGYEVVPILIKRARAGLPDNLGEHPSEKEFESFPSIVISNDGTKAELYRQIRLKGKIYRKIELDRLQ